MRHDALVPLLIGCGPTSVPTIIDVTLEPVILSAKEPIRAVPTAWGGTSKVPLTFEFDWLVDGYPRTETSETLQVADYAKNQEVSVTVVAWDGERSSEAFTTEPIVVINSRPVIHDVWFEPAQPRDGDTVTVYTDATDADGEPLSLRHTWLSYSGETKTGSRNTRIASKYESLQVRVVAWDGEQLSSPYVSDKVVPQ
ncbi:MAG: hypothetical protein AB8H79_04780 [Myxococcota bacterium]